MTNPRDLIKRLADEFECWIVHAEVEDIERAHKLVDEARAYLAQPEPEGPTEEELLNLGNDVMGDCLPCDPDLLLAFARAVLARWGSPPQ
jgi:hypothetical protein